MHAGSDLDIHLGPFRLVRPLARGGMAEVWRGEHEVLRTDVAIKVLTGARARTPTYVRALRNEIHAAARLYHPSIVLVFDRGEVDEDTAVRSRGRLVAGSPWFAMELAAHGSMSTRRFPLPFGTARLMLLSLLDALAHAHARGVIHRDLKPGNVLLCAPDSARPGLKLSDFGIAHAFVDDGRDFEVSTSGTPRYMAPEQFSGRARDLGPWTDLYALGCIAFQAAMGEAPFSGDHLHLAVAHGHDEVPPLKAASGDYPPGFEPWVLRLLAKKPEARFRTAADAAWALLQLPFDEVGHADPHAWELALRAPGSVASDLGGDTAAHTLAGTHAAPRDTGDVDGDALSPVADTLPPPSTVSLPRSPDGLGHLTNDGAVPMVDDEPTPVQRTSARPAPRPSLADHDADEGADDDEDGDKGSAGDRGDDDARRTGAGPRTRAAPPLRAASASPRVVAAQVRLRDSERAPRPHVPWIELAAMRAAGDENLAAGVGDEEHTRPRLLSRESRAPSRAFSLTRTERPMAARTPPPIATSWRRHDEESVRLSARRTRALLGAGLGMWGMRQTPLVDREHERDVLWRILVDAHRTRVRGHVVLVRGAAGIGKSRLCEWLLERAAEVGAATTLRGLHTPAQDLRDGLAGMLVRHAHATGLAGPALRERLREVFALDEDDADALGALGRDAQGTLATGPERWSVQLRALRALAGDRPILVWIDDVHWGDETLAFARFLLDEGSEARGIVLVLAATDEALAERPLESALLEQLQAHRDGVDEVRVPPLAWADHRVLVGDLLGLDNHLSELIVERTAGNPSFAVHVVGDFVQRGVLAPSGAGFTLLRGEEVAIPDDVHAVWSERILRVLSPLPLDARIAIEFGAVLGAESDEREWVALCHDAGLADPRAAWVAGVEAFERARLLIVERGTLRFSHAMVRESIKRLADEAGRLRDHNARAARVLQQFGEPDRTVARVAHHLVAAERFADAVPALLGATRVQMQRHGSARAHALLDEAWGIFERLALPARDPRRIEGWGLRARLLAEEGRYGESSMWAGLVLQHGDDAVPQATRDALSAQAQSALRRADIEAALACYRSLLAAADHDPSVRIEALSGIADAHSFRGQLAEAGATLTQALAESEARSDERGSCVCLWNLAYVVMWSGNLDEARAMLLRQQHLARRVGHRSLLASGRNAQGDVERLAGDPERARVLYDEALRLWAAIGSGKRRVALVNHALAQLASGHVAAAAEACVAQLAELERAGEPLLLSVCHGPLAVQAADDDDWSASDAHLAALSAPQQRDGLIDGERALLYEQIAIRAARRHDLLRADVAWELALDVWRALRREDGIARILRARASTSRDA